MSWIASLPRMEPAIQQAWVCLNLAPGPWVHPSYWPDLLEPALAGLLRPEVPQPLRRAAWRQANRRVLDHFELAPIETPSDPWLAPAMLAPPAWDRWIFHCGLAVMAPQIRRVIAGAEVQLLRASLGEAGLHFARRGAACQWDGPDAGLVLVSDQAVVQARQLGAALVSLGAAANPGPVHQRLRLRLPGDAQVACAHLPEPLSHASRAGALALSVLQEIDPSWCSWFPVRH